ncbi:S1 family peptidase [Patulibacter defluvii]|uniref:S1 family peptidase n=1 Tax=Patulibacter defluvii TaxID=3095358 RepID=UPI002A75C49C|nr:trypsin-like serine protease [Patulibacter sp. DM4]
MTSALEARGRARRGLLAAALAGLLAGALVAPATAVVGGARATPRAHAAVVSLADACTATLVAPDRLLTAGHCASHVDPGVTRVRIGGAAYVAARVARHPRFRYQLPAYPAQPDHDLAIVELDRPVPDIAPVALSTRPVRRGERLRLLGYGTSDPRRPGRFGVLRTARLVVRSATVCRHAIARADPDQKSQFHPTRMLCTQDPDGRAPYASGCNGDSGGPLLRWDRERRRSLLVGVDSWGVACGAQHGDPEVFVRVAGFRAFVLDPRPAWASARIRDPWDAAADAAG